MTNGECNLNTGGGTGGGACLHDGCTGPGKCVATPGSADCGGVIANVCGCDGRSYINECYARSAGTNVASSGLCDGG